MGKKGNILVVEDEEVMRDVLGTLLVPEGYQVDFAKTGEEGLDKFQQRPFDLILLDVSMPGMGGLRTLEELPSPHGSAEPSTASRNPSTTKRF